MFGEVQRIHIQDDIYQDGYILLDAYKPIGRRGGKGYVRVTDTFEMQRPTASGRPPFLEAGSA